MEKIGRKKNKKNIKKIVKKRIGSRRKRIEEVGRKSESGKKEKKKIRMRM